MINYNQTNDNCCAPMQVLPDDDMRRWACKQVVTMLANSDYYYTRDEVDRLIASIEPDITKEEVEQMIYQATSGKQNTLIAGDGIDITNDVISVTGGSIDSGAVQTMIDQSISGKSDTSAVTEVDSALTAHTSNSDIHVTSTEKETWNNKSDFSGSYNDLSDKPTIPTSASQLVNDEGYITSDAITGKADTTAVTAVNDALTAHTADTTIHVTSSDKQTWNNKADLSDIPSVSNYADSVMYNSSTHYVEFYHGGTGGTKVFEYDASPFIIDGMVQNVEIKDVTLSGESVTCLVVSFNTDAGHQDINIPISEIFDASNYYTKDDVDSIVSGKVDNSVYTAYTAVTDTILGGKADTTAVTAVNNALTAHTTDATIHVTSSDKTTWNGKQDALVSGTNIKTINNTSILGSGNIDIQGGNNVTVSGSTLVFN